jgi:hypothetical protein
MGTIAVTFGVGRELCRFSFTPHSLDYTHTPGSTHTRTHTHTLRVYADELEAVRVGIGATGSG